MLQKAMVSSQKTDHQRYVEIAKGSALECAACIDVMIAKRIITVKKGDEGKDIMEVVVKMLYKLHQSLN
jgi:four helix bundle protein